MDFSIIMPFPFYRKPEYLCRNLFLFMTKQEQVTIIKIISGKQISLKNEEINLLIS